MSPKIHSRIWKDDDFWQLDTEAKVTFLWLLTNGETDNCGHLVFSGRQFEADTGLKVEGVQKLGKALPRAFVLEGSHRWLRNFMRHQWSPGERGPNSKMWKSLVNAIASMPETLRKECLRDYPEFYAAVTSITSPLQAPSYKSPPPSEGPSPLQGPYKAPEQSRAEQSRALSSSSSEGGEGETPPVELPRGFPSSLEAAQAQSALAGVEPAIVAEVWHEAMAAGGRDFRDRPIRAWAHHVRAESLRKNRARKTGGLNGHASPTVENPTARRIRLESQLRLLQSEAENHIVQCGAPTEEEREDYAKLWQKIRALKGELA